MPNPPRLRAAALDRHRPCCCRRRCCAALRRATATPRTRTCRRQKLQLEGLPGALRGRGRRRRPLAAAGRRHVAVRHHEGPPRLGQAQGRHDRHRADPREGQRRRGQAHRLARSSTSAAPAARASPRCPPSATDYAKLRTRYDLVSFDPRGVGRSAGVQCEDDQQLDAYFQQDSTPDDAAEREDAHWTTPRSSTRPARRTPAKMLPHVAHHRRRPRHGPDAPGPRRRQAALLRHLVRHRTRRRLRPPVPQEAWGAPSSTRSSTRPRTPSRARSARPRASSSRSTTSPRTARRRPTDCPRRRHRAGGQGPDRQTARPTSTRKPIPGVGPRELTQTAATNGIAQALYSQGLLGVPHRGPGAGVRRRRQDPDAAVRLDERAQRERRVQQHRRPPTSPSTAPTTSRATPPPTSRRSCRSSARPPRCSATILAWGLVGCTDWAGAGRRRPPRRQRARLGADPRRRQHRRPGDARTRARGRWWTRWARASASS